MGKIDARLTQWHSATNRALTRGNQPHTRSICVTKVPSVPFLNKCSAGRSRVYTSASTRDVRKLATAELDFASFILKIFSITLTGNYVICISEVDSFGAPYLQLCGSRVETAESGPVISDKTSRNNIFFRFHDSRFLPRVVPTIHNCGERGIEKICRSGGTCNRDDNSSRSCIVVSG